MKLLRGLLRNRNISACLLLIFLSLAFFWKFFLRGLVPIPADIIVGIYYPWRDHIWNGYVTGVPYKNGILSDVVSIIYPWRVYGMELLKNGQWPLWIPYTLGGSPLLANFQSAVFYPLNFLFWILSDVNAWSAYIVLQPIMASLFCYLFLRNLKIGYFGSLLGAFTFAFSGFMITWLEYGIVGHAGLWLPLILLAIHKLFQKISLKLFLLGTFATAMSMLAGYPQITFYILSVAFLFILFRSLTQRRQTNKRAFLGNFLVSLSTLLFGVLLASVQVVPGVELWFQSIRQTDYTVASSNYGILPIVNFVTFIVPDFFGHPATLNFWGKIGYNEAASYVGILGLIFAVFAFFIPKSSEDSNLRFFKILLIISIIFTFNNPLAQIPYMLNLPGLGKSVAGRFLFLADFSLAILAAYGVENFFKEEKKRKFLLILLFFAIVFLALWVFVFYGARLLYPQSSWIPNLEISKRNMVLPSFIFLFAVVIAILNLFFSGRHRLLLKLIIFLVVVFDLFRFGWKYTPFTLRGYLYPPTNLTDFLQRNAGINRFVGLFPQSMWIPYKLSSLDGYEPLMIKRFSEFANQINESVFRPPQAGTRWVKIHDFSSPLLNVAGVKYLVSYKGVVQHDWDPEYYRYPREQFEMLFQYGKSQIYENKEALPRAFIVHDFQVLTDEEILKTLMDKNFNVQQTLLLEEKPENSPEKKSGEDRVVISEENYFSNQVLIKTESISDGFLFLSDNFYPGWKAFIDGKETKIYRANYAFRAIFLPAGEHEVRFLFQPQSFKIGLGISVLALLVLFGLLSHEIIRSSHPSSKRSA